MANLWVKTWRKILISIKNRKNNTFFTHLVWFFVDCLYLCIVKQLCFLTSPIYLAQMK